MNLVEKFLEFNRNNLASTSTVKNYGIDLRQFVPYLLGKDIDEVSIVDLQGVTMLQVRQSLEQLQEEKEYKVTTVNRRLASFRAMMMHYDIPTLKHMKSFNDTRLHEVEYIDNEDVKRLLNKAKSQDTEMYYILGLLFNTGLRSAELLSLRVENIHENCIIVEGKGGKMRKIELNSIAKECISTHLANLPSTMTGTVLNMRYETLRRHYTGFLKDCGIDCSKLHTTRKSFASNLIARGASLTDTAQLLGHSTTATLEKHYLGSKTKTMTVGLLD